MQSRYTHATKTNNDNNKRQTIVTSSELAVIDFKTAVIKMSKKGKKILPKYL